MQLLVKADYILLSLTVLQDSTGDFNRQLQNLLWESAKSGICISA